MVIIALVLSLIGIQSSTPVIGNESSNIANSMMAVVDFDARSGRAVRTGRNGTPQELPVKSGQVINSSESAQPLRLDFVGRKNTVRELHSAEDRYAVTYLKPRPYVHGDLGAFIPAANDSLFILAIKVGPEFRVKNDESPSVFVYRAMAERWANMSVASLVESLKRLPFLGDLPRRGPVSKYSASAREVASMAESLGPIRRAAVLIHLKNMGFREAEEPLMNALWAGRSDPDLDYLSLPTRISDLGSHAGDDFLVRSTDMLAKAEACSDDRLRALFVRSMTSGPYDKKRLARLLRSAESDLKVEILIMLGDHSEDWNFRKLSVEEQKKQLERFVQHWLTHYNV